MEEIKLEGRQIRVWKNASLPGVFWGQGDEELMEVSKDI